MSTPAMARAGDSSATSWSGVGLALDAGSLSGNAGVS